MGKKVSNKAKYERYRSENRREKNKQRNVERELRRLQKKHPDITYEIRQCKIYSSSLK